MPIAITSPRSLQAAVSFTPSLIFSVTNPTGMTFSTQTGKYIDCGSVYWFNISLVLTSKGTGGSGNTRISPMPFTAADTCPVFLRLSNVTLSANYSQFAVSAVVGTTYIALEQYGSAQGVNQIPWAQLADNSVLQVAGWISK